MKPSSQLLNKPLKNQQINHPQDNLQKQLFEISKDDENLLEDRPLAVNEMDLSNVKTWKISRPSISDK